MGSKIFVFCIISLLAGGCKDSANESPSVITLPLETITLPPAPDGELTAPLDSTKAPAKVSIITIMEEYKKAAK